MYKRNITNCKSAFWYFLYFSLIVMFLASCSKDNDDAKPTDNKLISYEYIKSYSKDEVYARIFFAKILLGINTGLDVDIKYGVDIYRVTYNTTHKNQKITASGVVYLPKETGESFPLLSFQNGTNTLHVDAPSLSFDSLKYQALIITAGLGFVTNFPDYIGFGSSSEYKHPYLVKEPTVTAVTDMIKATQEMLDKEDIKPQLNGDLYLFGYSQGGWSTLAVHQELEQNPIPGLTLKAVSCGAGPYNQEHIRQVIFSRETYPQPFYMPYILLSYKDLGIITEPLTVYFNQPYANKIPDLFNGQLSGAKINNELNDSIQVLYNQRFIKNFENQEFNSLRQAMADNSIEAWKVKTPLRLYHGTADFAVPASVSKLMYDQLISVGTDANVLTFIEMEDLDHADGLVPFAIESLEWFMSFKN